VNLGGQEMVGKQSGCGYFLAGETQLQFLAFDQEISLMIQF